MSGPVIDIAFLVIGIILIFFGLSLYKSFVKVIGFVVGAAYGVYLYTVFLPYLTVEPIFIFLIAAFLILILGIMGTFLARAANLIMFFLTGGLAGVIIGKMIVGMTFDDAFASITSMGIREMIKPEPSDLIWFLGGGILFLIALDTLIILALTALGAGLIWYVLLTWGYLPKGIPTWVVPAVLIFIGVSIQEATRRKSKPGTDALKIKKKPE